MIRIRPYKASDADTILSWCQDEKAFYQWTAGILGNYPITQNEFCFVESLISPAPPYTPQQTSPPPSSPKSPY